MKVALSLLFMGIMGNSAALRPAAIQLGRKPIGLRRGSGAFGVRPDSGFIQMPALRSVAEPGVIDLVARRYLAAGCLPGRFWLEAQVQLHRLRAAWRESAPELIKRAFDIFVSFLFLILLAPVFLLIGMLVKLEDRGPIFFAQTRVGRHGRQFKMYKIRSMCLNAEERLRDLLEKNQHAEGVTFKLKQDPRITRAGRWLRKFSLDELPQFYNVLIGDMSLVGPRPPVPREVAKYTLADRRRLAVKPGITCIWQISGRSEIDFSRQVQLDVSYIENRSFLEDLRILALTLPAVLSGKGAC